MARWRWTPGRTCIPAPHHTPRSRSYASASSDCPVSDDRLTPSGWRGSAVHFQMTCTRSGGGTCADLSWSMPSASSNRRWVPPIPGAVRLEPGARMWTGSPSARTPSHPESAYVKAFLIQVCEGHEAYQCDFNEKVRRSIERAKLCCLKQCSHQSDKETPTFIVKNTPLRQ